MTRFKFLMLTAGAALTSGFPHDVGAHDLMYVFCAMMIALAINEDILY